MKESEAKLEASYLLALFPNMSPEQGLLAAREFLPYDVRIVRRVVDEHRMTHPQWVNLPQLREALRAAVAARHAERRRERAEELALRDWWQSAEELITEMTDEDLEEMKTYALSVCPLLDADGKAFLARKDPRKSRALQGMIADVLMGERRSNQAPAPARSAAPVAAAPLSLDLEDAA